MQRPFDMEQFLTMALAEDIGAGDVTGNATIGAGVRGVYAMNAREKLVVCGVKFLPQLFALVDPQITVEIHAGEGALVDAGTKLATLRGPVRGLLAGERTALNLVQQLSGVATLTRHYVDAVAGTGARVHDTRKTIPGMRALQKYAVSCGGGQNHRMGLYDAVLIKDNHIAAAGGVKAAITAARAHAPGIPIEVECDTLEQLNEALAAGVDIVLLDNMSNDMLREGVARAHAQSVLVEASGNVNLETIRAIADTGVDRISVGKLTHSARAVDIGLDAV